MLEEGTKKWYEMRPDRAKETLGKQLHSIFDAILSVLRMLTSLSSTVLVGHAEACWVLLGLCHKELRQEAYQKRRVMKEEKELGATWKGVEGLVFVAPMAFPLVKMQRQLLNALPELARLDQYRTDPLHQ